MGARPLYLSLALIIEEGLPLETLEKVMDSIRKVLDETGVKIVTGDTKVVNHGSADKLFINTAGIGLVSSGFNVSGANARPGDKILINGPIGDHGVAVMAQRENLRFKVAVQSDCAPLSSLVAGLTDSAAGTLASTRIAAAIHCMRDPTRGGLATALNEMASQSQVSFLIDEEKIPIKEVVRSACDMLGLDPLYVANEGKLVAVVAPEKVETILNLMRRNRYGTESAIIGEVKEGHAGRVILKTRLGASRIIDMLSGDLLPRIC
jgi:hydrogenase expression/formation protein HypE